MGTKEQAVNENVIREKEMGNGERETIKIKLRSPVRVSLVSHLSLLYFCFLSKFYFALYLLYWSQKSFKKRIRCLSKKPDNSIQRTLPDGSVRLRTFAPVIRRFCSISTTDVRFQTVQSDLGRLRLFSCVSIQFRKLLRPFPVGSFRFKTRCDSYLTGPTFRIGTVRSNFRLAGVYKDSRLGTNDGNPTWRHVWKNNIYKT